MFRKHPERDLGRSGKGFFATLAAGFCAIVIAAIFCGTGVGLYGLNIADRKTDNFIEFARAVAGDIPELAAALPPVIGDAFADERRPGYIDQIAITATMPEPEPGQRRVYPTIEVHNNGDEVVSLLSFRVAIFDDKGRLVGDFNEWGATPIAAEDEWRGPLQPNAKRVFLADTCSFTHKSNVEDMTLTVEVTDVRVWNPELRRAPGNSNVSQHADDAHALAISLPNVTR